VSSREFFRDPLPCGSRRQRPAILFEYLDPLIDDLTKLRIDLCFVIAVAAWAHETGALTNEALVFVGPFDDLYIPGAVVHDFDSSITRLTSFS
jgi:hypothetical protein